MPYICSSLRLVMFEKNVFSNWVMCNMTEGVREGPGIAICNEG
jgi:hypothetical protein